MWVIINESLKDELLMTNKQIGKQMNLKISRTQF